VLERAESRVVHMKAAHEMRDEFMSFWMHFLAIFRLEIKTLPFALVDGHLES